MTQVPFEHLPVMRDEVVDLLASVPAGVVVDATLGGGGHAAALLTARDDTRVIGIDRDPAAVEAAAERLAPFGSRVALRRARFDRIADEVAAVGWGETVSGVLFDLGVSSPQLDRPERGFSYREPGPLDMRMDPAQGLTAAEVVNSYDARALADLFRANGEGRFAMRIARAVVAGRPWLDTAALAVAVRDAIPAPARRTGGHPAKRVFQAIRIEVNAELDVLEPALTSALDLLVPGGRLVVLSYHSGEDRVVKRVMTDASTGGCTCPPGLPCICGAVSAFRLVFRGSRTPSAAEITANPRSESARLRVVERLAA